MRPPGVEVSAQLKGLTARLSHGPSGATFSTEPPRDNGGSGAAFSPTDLLAAALGACALTTLALVARREGLPWKDGSARVEKHMASAPRRVAELTVELSLSRELPEALRPRYEEIARTCPVALSLHPDVQVPMLFRYV